ncbi:MAG: polysaccharide biosynthesis/export family protein [Cytophagaceae bacterium]|nr:polysaccharide biosynthesis/export family protein [Cytophagaceae bacterium]
MGQTQTQNNPIPTTNTPTTKNTQEKQATNNRTTPINRTPTNATTNTRDITMEPADLQAIELEEQTRLDREAELAKDLAKSKIIKRTFGSSVFSNSKFDASANVNVATPNNYVLGPGDKLNLDIYGYSQANQTATVNTDGFIVLQKAGIVNVAGLNIDEAEKKKKMHYQKSI